MTQSNAECKYCKVNKITDTTESNSSSLINIR